MSSSEVPVTFGRAGGTVGEAGSLCKPATQPLERDPGRRRSRLALPHTPHPSPSQPPPLERKGLRSTMGCGQGTCACVCLPSAWVHMDNECGWRCVHVPVCSYLYRQIRQLAKNGTSNQTWHLSDFYHGPEASPFINRCLFEVSYNPVG